MLKKLKAALQKAVDRLTARGQEQAAAEASAHSLSREIRSIRSDLNALHAAHKRTAAQLDDERAKPSPNGKLEQRLQRTLASQEADIEGLVRKLERKLKRRVGLRDKAKKAQKRAAWWLRRQTILRKKLKDAKAQWKKDHKLEFQSWMLNGCPGNIDSDVEAIIAYAVVVCGQYVTATTNGTHAVTSWHYSGHAVDLGASSVASMQECATKLRSHFGRDHFLELFSPCPWYIKNGVEYAGYFPDHGDHCHAAVA